MHPNPPVHHRHHVPSAAVLVSALLLGPGLLVGCGGEEEPAPAGDASSGTADSATTTPTPTPTPESRSERVTAGTAPRPADGADLDPRVRAAVTGVADAADAAPGNAAARRELALSLHANGFREEALEAWTDVIELDAEMADAWYHRARLRYEAEDRDGAMTDIDRAVELAPQDAAMVARRGLWHLEAGRTEAAETDLERARALAPRHRPTLEGLALVWIETDRHERAMEEILVPMRNRGATTPHARLLAGRALERMERAEDAAIELEAGAGSSIDWTGADRWVAAVGAFAVGDDADLRRAGVMIQDGRTSAAISVLQPLVNDAATDAAARTLLARALRRTGELARATELLSEGVAAQPEDASLLTGLAETRLAAGDGAAAARFAQRAIEADPTRPRAFEVLAQAAFGQEQWTDAEAAARAAVALEPTRRLANLFLGLAIDRQPDRRAEAFDQLQLTRRRHPDWWEPYYYLGVMLGRSRQFEEAARFADRAERLSPGNQRVAELQRVIDGQRGDDPEPPPASP